MIRRTFKAMISIWGVYRTTDSNGDLVVGGEEALGEKAKEKGENVPYISISQVFIGLPQNHLWNLLKKNANGRTPSKDPVAQ